MAIEVFCSAWDGGTRELPIKYNEKRGICTPEDGREMGVKMLEAYFDRWLLDDALWEVLEVEKEFSFKLENGMEITGIIDLIVRDTQTKEILVVDHKTASQVVDQDFLQMENQVSTYYLGAQSLGYKVDGAVFNYIYKYVKPKCERYPVKRNDQQIAEFLEDVKGTLEAMADDKYKYKNITKDCNWCDYWEWCRGNQEMYTKASDGSTEASEEEE
jgi:RecB family exonuclease